MIECLITSGLGSEISSLLATAAGGEQGLSWLETIQRGSVVGYIIIGLSIAALALVVMHLFQIRRQALLPAEQIEFLDQTLARGDVGGALEYCISPENDSYLTRVMAAGLTRYQKSAFGAFEIKNAIEEAGEDQTAKLYRSTDGLGVIGTIAPLLGLLGTVLGMVGAFESLSTTATTNHEQMASSISMALVTTLMGLILAIPCIALYTFFRNRIDAFASEAAMEIEQLALHLESAPTSGARSSARPMPQRTPGVGGASTSTSSASPVGAATNGGGKAGGAS